MTVLAIIGLVVIGFIGGAIMCDVMMVDGCLETSLAFILGALGSIGVAVGFVGMFAIIIAEVF
jgi:hypothetical protein